MKMYLILYVDLETSLLLPINLNKPKQWEFRVNKVDPLSPELVQSPYALDPYYDILLIYCRCRRVLAKGKLAGDE